MLRIHNIFRFIERIRTRIRQNHEISSIIKVLRYPPRSLEEISLRVELCHHALDLVNRTKHPAIWAAFQYEMGNNLAKIMQHRTENLEKAIGHFQQALKVYTRESFPENWAMTQYILGLTYANRICGESADNIEQAIGYYQQALEVLHSPSFPRRLGQYQDSIGGRLRYARQRGWYQEPG